MAQDDVFGVKPSTRAVPPGVTNAVLVEGLEFETGSIFEQVSGSSVVILGTTFGSTLGAGDLAALYNGGTAMFLVQSGRSINIEGAPRYYVAAIGATAVVQWLRGTRAGY